MKSNHTIVLLLAVLEISSLTFAGGGEYPPDRRARPGSADTAEIPRDSILAGPADSPEGRLVLPSSILIRRTASSLPEALEFFSGNSHIPGVLHQNFDDVFRILVHRGESPIPGATVRLSDSRGETLWESLTHDDGAVFLFPHVMFVAGAHETLSLEVMHTGMPQKRELAEWSDVNVALESSPQVGAPDAELRLVLEIPGDAVLQGAGSGELISMLAGLTGRFSTISLEIYYVRNHTAFYKLDHRVQRFLVHDGAVDQWREAVTNERMYGDFQELLSETLEGFSQRKECVRQLCLYMAQTPRIDFDANTTYIDLAVKAAARAVRIHTFAGAAVGMDGEYVLRQLALISRGSFQRAEGVSGPLPTGLQAQVIRSLAGMMDLNRRRSAGQPPATASGGS